MKLRTVLLFFILVSLLDALCTKLTIAKARIGIYETELEPHSLELNPVASHIIQNFGIDGMIIFKFILVTIICSAVLGFKHKYPKLGIGVPMIAVMLTGFVVLYTVVNWLGWK